MLTAPLFNMTIEGMPVTGLERLAISNPATEEIVGYATQCSDLILEDAVKSSARAQLLWAKTSDQKKRDACVQISQVIEQHAQELAQLLSQEQGKPLKGLGAEFEIGGAIAWSAYAASLELPIKIIEEDESHRIEQHRTPIGVVGAITPWNWPVMIAIWHIVPAIRAGNSVIIKPSPYTPLSTLRLVELINTVLPKGLLNCVSGDGSIGAKMSAHSGIQKIVFTGSTETGKIIMRASADNLKRLTLELGGNDAGIVLEDANPAAIAEGIFWGAFINSGQTCAALKRLYVPESLYEAMCQELVALANTVPMGNGLDEGIALGPLQNKMQFDKIVSLVEDSRTQGARILSGGAPTSDKGYFFPITLVADLPPGARLIEEEQFGTVLPIIKYTNLDEAIDQANRLDVGLAASVWSSDTQIAFDVAKRLEAGTVYINKHGELAPNVPFGGIKGSGIGVEFGQEGLEANTNIKIYSITK